MVSCEQLGGVDVEGLAELRVHQVEIGAGSSTFGHDRANRPEWVNGEFVRGPLPLSWWGRACAIPGGKSILATALAIWFESGRRNKREGLNLTGAIVKRFGVTPSAKSRALGALEKAGLIRVERRGRKNPRVTLLEVEQAKVS